jgi:hypothetical protein
MIQYLSANIIKINRPPKNTYDFEIMHKNTRSTPCNFRRILKNVAIIQNGVLYYIFSFTILIISASDSIVLFSIISALDIRSSAN